MSDAARKAAGALAKCKWLREYAKEIEDQAKAVLAQELSGGERTKAIDWDGTEIGSVTRAEGARSMQIDNEAGFVAWVKQRYPTEIEETVRSAFVKVCAEKVKVLGCLPDANGVACPHVSLAHAEPKAVVSLGDNDRLRIEQIFTRRPMDELKALKVADNPIFPRLDEQRELLDTDMQQSEPFIEEGPPNWAESNTFETSDAVKNRRR